MDYSTTDFVPIIGIENKDALKQNIEMINNDNNYNIMQDDLTQSRDEPYPRSRNNNQMSDWECDRHSSEESD